MSEFLQKKSGRPYDWRMSSRLSSSGIWSKNGRHVAPCVLHFSWLHLHEQVPSIIEVHLILGSRIVKHASSTVTSSSPLKKDAGREFSIFQAFCLVSLSSAQCLLVSNAKIKENNYQLVLTSQKK